MCWDQLMEDMESALPPETEEPALGDGLVMMIKSSCAGDRLEELGGRWTMNSRAPLGQPSQREPSITRSWQGHRALQRPLGKGQLGVLMSQMLSPTICIENSSFPGMD